MIYDPATGKTENLGIPYPGDGVIDVVADEARGLIYVVTCEHQHWMVYDTKAPARGFRWLGPLLSRYASTLVDARGRANAITRDYQMARWDPATNTLTQKPIIVDGRTLRVDDREGWIPSWCLTDGGKTAYLTRMSLPELIKLDLGGDIDKPVKGTVVGKLTSQPGSTSLSALGAGADGKIYAAIAHQNKGQWGPGAQLTHLSRFDPDAGTMLDLGIIVIRNKDYFDFSERLGPDGKEARPPWSHGYATLPDGNLAPQYHPQGAITARDGSVYLLHLYPYTLARVDASQIAAAVQKATVIR